MKVQLFGFFRKYATLQEPSVNMAGNDRKLFVSILLFDSSRV